MVSATCSRCSRVSRGRIVDRPKPSVIPGIRVSGEFELLSDHCKSREYCTRRWLIRRNERALVNDAATVSVATCSVPLSEMPWVVTGLEGSRNTLFAPEYRDVLTRSASWLCDERLTSSFANPALPSNLDG